MPDFEVWVDTDSQDGDGRLLAQEMTEMVEDATLQAVEQLAYDWLYMAQADCPVDTGYLMSTGRASNPRIEGNQIVCEVGYDAPYARYVHERSPEHAQWLATAGAVLAGSAESRLSRVLTQELGKAPEA